ncbi:MAG: hypothetical protein CVU05_10845, partial [Bacteroidetes bacterium HGW-Bacteroidetes-21]
MNDYKDNTPCDLILSLVKVINIISNKLTFSTSLNDSLNIIFENLEKIPQIKKSMVFIINENESFTNAYNYNTNPLSVFIHPDNELYPILIKKNENLVSNNIVFPQPLDFLNQETELKTFIIPSIINNEILASSIILCEIPDSHIETFSALLDIAFTKLGAVIGRLDFERLIKEQQTNLNNLLTGINEMLFIVNRSGRILHFNPSVIKTLGYNEDELCTMSVFDIKSLEERETVALELDKAFNQENSISYLPYICVNGRVIPAETTMNIGIWNGKPILILLARNLTEFVNAKNEIILSRIKAENANKAKSHFLKKMSHEFRIPLNSILGMTELMMKTELNQKQFNFMNVVMKSTENLLGILNDILDISKIENNELALQCKSFSLKELIQLVVNTNFYTIQNKGVELLSAYGKYGKDYIVQGDPLRLYQILMNLTRFGISQTQVGKIEIQVNEKNSDKDGLTLEFCVKDTSNGISPEEIEEIYKSFRSGRYDLYNPQGQSGMDLYISWHLINIMKGELKIESNVQGNTFFFEIQMPHGDVNEIASNSEKMASLSESSKHFKILLAEDQVFNQMVVQAMVEEWGFSIDIAENGMQVIEKLKNNGLYNLILMDIQMPQMDGIEATKIIRNEFQPPISEIPIIAITAHAYADEHKKFI